MSVRVSMRVSLYHVEVWRGWYAYTVVCDVTMQHTA